MLKQVQQGFRDEKLEQYSASCSNSKHNVYPKEGLSKNVWLLSCLVNITSRGNVLIKSVLGTRTIIDPHCPFGVSMGCVYVFGFFIGLHDLKNKK